MSNLVAVALYYGDPLGPAKGFLSVIFFIIVIALCCATGDNKNSQKTKSKTTYKQTTYRPRYEPEDECEYQNYDPTWDDAFFEKYGGEPLFDDNPWDHEKK